LSASTPRAKARRYSSPVRERLAEKTRQRILEALARQFGRPDAVDVNVTEAAKEAGVSVRTVYRCFPDRAARVEALAEWTNEALGPVDHPLDTADDIPGFTRAAYAHAERQEAFWRIGMVPGLSSDVRRARHGRMRRRIRELLDEIGASGPETERASRTFHELYWRSFPPSGCQTPDTGTGTNRPFLWCRRVRPESGVRG
jgi:AcrR family transcriptional regulator